MEASPRESRSISKFASKKNTILELITIYRRMKKGRNQDVYRMQLNVGYDDDSEMNDVNSPIPFYDFEKYRNLKLKKYLFFNGELSIFDDFFNSSFYEMMNKKDYYWLNIFCPSEEDLEILGKNYGVHDISLNDIREGNTEEKVEVFKNYIFISLKILTDKKKGDLDFNILLFENFVITTHNKPWKPIIDILNFIYLISVHTTMYPEWVFFSVIIEFVQDVKHLVQDLHPEVLELEGIYILETDITDILKKNFKLVYKVYNLQQFIKYKIQILTTFKIKLVKKLRKPITRYLQFTLTDFIEIEKDLKEYNRILERSQDLYLALADLEHSKKENEINTIMKRFAFIAFILLPIQTIAGLWGMNVPLPLSSINPGSLKPFILLCLSSFIITIIIYALLTYGNKIKNLYRKGKDRKED